MQNPPRHQSEAGAKSLLLTIADVRNSACFEFFNSLGYEQTE